MMEKELLVREERGRSIKYNVKNDDLGDDSDRSQRGHKGVR